MMAKGETRRGNFSLSLSLINFAQSLVSTNFWVTLFSYWNLENRVSVRKRYLTVLWICDTVFDTDSGIGICINIKVSKCKQKGDFLKKLYVNIHTINHAKQS